MTHAAGSRVGLRVNRNTYRLDSHGAERLSTVLRDELGLTGTKIGCEAGDCGICTVLLDGQQACACLVPVMQAERHAITTVEGLSEVRADDGRPVGRRLQQSFARLGAAQCGICTPGMLMAATELLLRDASPTQTDVERALGGVLCRCTGYQQIVAAVVAAGGDEHVAEGPEHAFAEAAGLGATDDPSPHAISPVGQNVARLDGAAKLDGTCRFADDFAPPDTLDMLVVRSPYARASFALGDFDAFVAERPGVHGVVTAADIPNNRYAIFAELRDQPALADAQTRFLGEAVLALVGERAALNAIDPADLPIAFEPLEAIASTEQALAGEGAPVQARYPDNVLCRGHVQKGGHWPEASISHVVTGSMHTEYVEHAYLEPEAGHAVWHGDDADFTVSLFVSTQTPYLDRDELAYMFDLAPTRVRIIPSAVGGGFGGKLDMSVQPLVVAAARKFGRPARLTLDRRASMLDSPKRHPAAMSARLGADAQGRFVAYEFSGDFNTGAYASWGPTVANRVPIHACGPYRFDQVRADTRAILTNDAVAGAFRGFGVPQSTLLVEGLIDDLAARLDVDPMVLRRRNALQVGDRTATGQRLEASVGLIACLDALEQAWSQAGQRVRAFNESAASSGGEPPTGAASDSGQERRSAWPTDPHGTGAKHRLRRGRGLACMWYGIGNTVMANPSTMHVGLRANGRLMLYNGAVDIGQGTYTVMPQICAQALGVPIELFDQIQADTGLTADAGKSSASRQTFVSGNAARLAGEHLRAQLCQALGLGLNAALTLLPGVLEARTPAGQQTRLDLTKLPANENGDLFVGEGYFNPPTVPLDEHGQGVPYAAYGYAAQIAEIELDLELGTIRLVSMAAAHDVGRAINPMLVEGQIYGGIAQGIGLALMEHYIAGKTDNLHDYLIPTVGDMPPIEIHLVEDREPLGPFGAKGVGEPALVATAPAILNAVYDACGVRIHAVPATPDRIRAAIVAQGQGQ